MSLARGKFSCIRFIGSLVLCVKRFSPEYVLILLLSSVFCFGASAGCFPAPPNLVGWWPGDGSATNIAGTNQGTLQGGATANTPGFVGSAFNFDGTNGFVQITNGPLLQPTNLTIEAWVRFSSLDSAGSGGSPAGDQYIVFKQNSRSGNFEGYDLSKTRVGGVDVFRFMVASAAGLEIEIHSATTVSTGAWYHVAATRGSNFIQLYVNGVMERQTNVAFPQDYGNFPLYFGTSGQSFWDHKLKGSLDEVSLYNRALSSNEIAAIYATGAAGKCKAPNLTTQPQSTAVSIGRNVTFSAAATGYGLLGYQWRQNGTAIPGATATSLILTNVQPVAAGSYSVAVANALGSVTSSNAILTVVRPGALLDVDFDGGTNTSEIGPAAIGQNSNDFWNLYQGAGGFRSQGGFEPLTTADGTSTPVAINLPNAPGSWGNGSSDPMYNGYVYPTFQASSTPMFINVTNLPPGSYDFYLYASDGNFEIAVDAVDYGIRTSLDNPLTNPPVWMEGTQFVLFRDVAITNSAQAVLITVRPGIYGFAIISGLQIARYTPLILLQPANAAVITGSNIVLQVAGDSVPAPGYQWFFNGNPVLNGGRTAGATSGTLTISNAQPADAGGYFAVLTSTGGSATSSVATVLVGLRPGIVQSPTGQNKAVGDSVQFTVTASGTAPFGYQWLLNGAPLSDDARHAGSATTTLAITNLVLGDAGNYAAVVSNAFGTVTSAVAVLTVSVPPGFTRQPQSQTNSAGNLVSLGTIANGTLPIAYQWFFNGTPLANNGRIVGADANSLSILSAVTNDTGNYWLVASNLIGVATSAVATLAINPAVCSSTVTGLVSWWTGDGNAFDSAGTNHGLLVGNASYGPGFVGQAFVLDGSSDGVSVGNPANLQLQDFTVEAWIKRADPAIATHGSHTTALIFSYGSLGYGFGLWNDGRLFLTRVDIDNVTVSAGITDTNFHHVAVTKSGSAVIFYIDGTAFPAPAYSTPFSFGTVAAIGMRADTLDDSFLGSIDEVAVYNRPLAASEIQTIYYSSSMGKCPLPPLFAQSPQSALVAVGSNTVLSAAVTGSQPFAFQWFFNNVPLLDGGGITGSTTPSLIFTNIQTNASGAYLLVASNSVGSVTSAVANLIVFIPPSFVTQPTNQSWIIGSNGTLVALATGTEPISYQWQHAGTNLTDNSRISGSTTGSLTVSNVQTTDAGSYTVIASNLGSSIPSQAALVTVFVPPTFSRQPVGASVPLSFAVSFSATVAGTAPFGYQWLFNGSPIPNAAGLTLVISNVAVGQIGNYQIVATNFAGAVTSSVAQLTLGTVAVWGNFSPAGPGGPVWPPAGVSNVVAIAAGSSYSLALRVDGTIVEWGSNVSVTNFPANLSDIVGIAAGDNHVLALRSNGTVFAWGLNNAGQTNVPANLSNVVAVAAGTSHSAALRSDGTVVVWGGTATDAQTNIPAGLFPVTRIDGGALQTLALRADGTVVSWGGIRNPAVPAGLKGVAGISASPSSTGFDLAVDTNGLVTAWGSGPGTNVPAGLHGIVAVEAGGFEASQTFGLGLRSNGMVIAWGSSFQSGVTNVPAGVSNAVAIAAGSSHALAILNDGRPLLLHPPVGGTFYSGRDLVLPATAVGNAPLSFQWFKDGSALANATNQTLVVPSAQSGDAGSYQFVVSNALGVAQSVFVPVIIVDSPPVLMSQPANGYAYYGSPFSVSASVIGSGPLTFQWLQNGLPGPGGTNYLVIDRALPQHGGAYQLIASNSFGAVTSSVAQITFSRVAAWGTGPALSNAPVDLGTVTAVASGYFHALAIKPDGTVAAWGTTANGVTNVPPGLSNVVAVAGGSSFSVALKADGTVVAWGAGSVGQTNVPAGLSNVVAISAGASHVLALRSNGTVVAWGLNSTSQATVPAGLSNVVAVAAGSIQSLALRNDGTMVGWGGIGKIPSTTNVVAIAAGYSQSLALQADGTVVGWGATPQPAGAAPPAGLSNVVAISAGGGAQGFFHSIALKSDGTMVGWGNNSFGQLNVPGMLDSAIAISAGGGSSLALLNDRSPVVTAQPFNRHAASGTNVTLAGLSVGQPALGYQWFFNNASLPGATSQTLTLPGVNRNSRGLYSLSVSNALGATNSLAAQLDVGGPVRLLPPVAGADGTLSVALQDSFGGSLTPGDLAHFEVLASTNLVDWTPLPGALVYTNGALLLQDGPAANHPARFYRILEQ